MLGIGRKKAKAEPQPEAEQVEAAEPAVDEVQPGEPVVEAPAQQFGNRNSNRE